jgi:hypothetical protein
MGKVSAGRKGANESREIGGFDSTAFDYSCVVGHPEVGHDRKGGVSDK